MAGQPVSILSFHRSHAAVANATGNAIGVLVVCTDSEEGIIIALRQILQAANRADAASRRTPQAFAALLGLVPLQPQASRGEAYLRAARDALAEAQALLREAQQHAALAAHAADVAANMTQAALGEATWIRQRRE